MRFNPDAYASHPILRPYSGDYPNGEFDADMTVRQVGANLEISVSFRIDEPAVRDAVSSGAAACCAYMYCRTSSYSDTFRAASASERLVGFAPLNALTGRIEVHPFVIALDDVTIPSTAANAEYGDAPIVVPRLRQLAAGEPWVFEVGADGGVESAIRLSKDAESGLAYGEFDFDAEPEERHIIIRMNPETYERFNEGARRDSGLSMSTVYLAALATALARLRENRDGEVEEVANGWASIIRARLREKGISLESESVGLAAQRLLDNPLTHILREGER